MVVEPGSIPWQLLQVVGMRPPAHGGTGLEQTTFIQRVNTSGGVAPAILDEIPQKRYAHMRVIGWTTFGGGPPLLLRCSAADRGRKGPLLLTAVASTTF